jgi:hypothetical protein
MTREELEVGKTYNVNGTEMAYKFSTYSVGARQMQHWFFHAGGHFNASLLDRELQKFII